MTLACVVGCSSKAEKQPSRGERVVTVETSPIDHGTFVARGAFSGSLEAHSKFTVTSRTAGTITAVTVDIGDAVKKGQVVVRLDDDEVTQSALQSDAELAVAQADIGKVQSALDVANRELERAQALRDRKVISESELDEVRAAQRSTAADLAVAKARVTQARANRKAAQIRTSYTHVQAQWDGPGDQRTVGERFVEPGDTVSANTPMLSVVDLDPMVAVVFVTERDYPYVKQGQTAVFEADAFADRQFEGRVSRIAPIFREDSRQARVEFTLPNPSGELRPGMFVSAELKLREIPDSAIVPNSALTKRSDVEGVFVLDKSTMTVRWTPVTVIARSHDQVALKNNTLQGEVVTLGQQMLSDGAKVQLEKVPPP